MELQQVLDDRGQRMPIVFITAYEDEQAPPRSAGGRGDGFPPKTR
jgi:hypothetical protein